MILSYLSVILLLSHTGPMSMALPFILISSQRPAGQNVPWPRPDWQLEGLEHRTKDSSFTRLRIIVLKKVSPASKTEESRENVCEKERGR